MPEAKLPAENVRAHYARVNAWWTEHEKAGRIVAGVARRLQGAGRIHAFVESRRDDISPALETALVLFGANLGIIDLMSETTAAGASR